MDAAAGVAAGADAQPPAATGFRELSAEPRVQQVDYAHLSVELDHLYMEDLQRGQEHLRARLARVRPWFDAAVASFAAAHPGVRPRISTCFLIDDYFSDLVGPAELVERLLDAAGHAGLRIDYLARESGCATAGTVRPAELVAARLVSVPTQGTTGARPPTARTGWLSNGRRSPDTPNLAMRRHVWEPPLEADKRRHSVFVDVELWDEPGGERVWSCPMLAAVWQLLRLGLLRDEGRCLVRPRPLPASLPKTWSAMPAVTRIEPRAAAFHGYRTLSLLEDRFLPVEHAVRVILNQVKQDPDVMEMTAARAAREGTPVPGDVPGRIGYVFLPGD
jgi:hypothetical protein